MQEKQEEVWDYVFTEYTKTPIHVTAGQVLTIKFAASTNANGYIYFSRGGILSPTYQRAVGTYSQGGTLTKEVLVDGDVYFGANDTASQYYMFRGDYIKVRIS